MSGCTPGAYRSGSTCIGPEFPCDSTHAQKKEIRLVNVRNLFKVVCHTVRKVSFIVLKVLEKWKQVLITPRLVPSNVCPIVKIFGASPHINDSDDGATTAK